MLRRLLLPFLPAPDAPPRTLALWALFLLGAPFAGWLALELHEFEKARRR